MCGKEFRLLLEARCHFVTCAPVAIALVRAQSFVHNGILPRWRLSCAMVFQAADMFTRSWSPF